MTRGVNMPTVSSKLTTHSRSILHFVMPVLLKSYVKLTYWYNMYVSVVYQSFNEITKLLSAGRSIRMVVIPSFFAG